MRFEDTKEWKQSIAMRPACTKVLCDVFGVTPEDIERFDKNSPLFILDREHAIDMRVKLQNGSHLLGQEKALSFEYYRFRTFTMELWQNRYAIPPEPGEFFKIASQFYLHGYSGKSGDDFIEWMIVDVLRLINWLKAYGVDRLSEHTRAAGGSRASFLYIEYDKIPSSFVIARHRK